MVFTVVTHPVCFKEFEVNVKEEGFLAVKLVFPTQVNKLGL
jgi:hypothetical protein